MEIHLFLGIRYKKTRPLFFAVGVFTKIFSYTQKSMYLCIYNHSLGIQPFILRTANFNAVSMWYFTESWQESLSHVTISLQFTG